MKRIAAPMIGGVITSGIWELLIYPVIFVVWRRRYLARETRNSERVWKMGGTGYQPVFGGNLPPNSAAGWWPAATG